MVTELIRPVNYNPGRSQKLIKEISSCRCSQLKCNGYNGETHSVQVRLRTCRGLHNGIKKKNDETTTIFGYNVGAVWPPPLAYGARN